MAVNDAGHDELPGGVNHLSVFRRLDGLADFRNLAILNQDGTVLDGAMRNGEDGGVLNQDDRGRFREIARSRVARRHKEENSSGAHRDSADLGCVPHRPPPRTVEPGLTPVKSRERPTTLMEPFNVVRSKVPEKITSVGPWSTVMSPLGGSLGFSGSRISNRWPSTKTILIFVFSSKMSPSATTRFAIFPFSIEPKRSATPKISAGDKVSARSAASGASPASIDFFAALTMSFGVVMPPE